MNSMSESDSSRRKYSKISINRRAKLVQLIIEDNYTIAKASKRLGIKASTARMILNKYKQTGDFPMKNFKRTARTPSKKSQLPLKEITQSINQEEKEDPQVENQVSRNCQEQQVGNSITGSANCNWVYFWVCPEYSAYPYYIL